MKTLTALILAGLLFASCTASQSREDRASIALAIKNEGDVFLAQGDYTQALGKLLAAEKMLPGDPFLQNSLGLAYMGKKRGDLAVEAFKKALAAKTDYTEARNNLGAAYLQQEKWDLAIETSKQVLESLVYETPHFPLSNTGFAYMGKRDYRSAQIYFEKALVEKPWFITASHGLVQVYKETGRIKHAMDFLHQCLHRHPDVAILHADLAQLYEIKGMTRQAVRSWQLVIKLSSEGSFLSRKAGRRLSELL